MTGNASQIFGNACKIYQMKTCIMFYFSYFANFSLSRNSAQLIVKLFSVFFILMNFFLWQGTATYSQTGFSALPTGSGETDSLYREMLSSVEGAISISARVRQQVNLFGQEYNASGTYDELKTTEFRGKGAVRFRLDMQLQSPGDAKEVNSNNSLTIVCDNTYNYIYRFYSVEGENHLERIEIKRLVEAIEKQGRNDIQTEVGSMFGLGGLAGMLREMRNRYDFNTAPVKTPIQEKNSVMDVWKIRGQLKPEIVASFAATVTGKKPSIPKHTPTAIDVYIGVDDRFPYRFDYFWTADGTESTGEPFAYLLFYNLILHDGNISETIFDYRPPANILSEDVDVTDQVINRMLH